MATVRRTWPLIIMWALVLGVLFSLLADWGEWDRFVPNLLWRMLIIAIGGALGLVFNYFGANYVTMGTQVVESMGLTKFSGDTQRQIANTFIFVMAFVAAIIAAIF